jgi:branched-chain amino acid transport system ATP-binding protein
LSRSRRSVLPAGFGRRYTTRAPAPDDGGLAAIEVLPVVVRPPYPVPENPPVLMTWKLAAGFNGNLAVADVDLSVDRGQILAVLGMSGSGKTAVAMTLAGLLQPLGGHILLGGVPARTGSVLAMSRAGVAFVPDDRGVFRELSVLQNFRLATKRGTMTVDEALDLFPALRSRVKLRAGLLSGGEQQMLALARAVMQRPRILLVDDMVTGLAPRMVETLKPIVRRAASEAGTAVVLVERHARLALDLADFAVVLARGGVALAGSAEELRADYEAVEAVYLGHRPRGINPER